MVTVYASSSAALRPVYYDAARRVGELLAEAGKSIIYGAGGGGLMGSMADGALNRNGEVYGVVPEFLQDLELTHTGLTGITITKLDGTARGGVLFGIAHELGLPIRFIGVGEAAKDLRPFDAGSFVNAILPIG